MGRVRAVALGLCMVAIGAAKPPPSSPPVLAHSSPWDVHTSENACVLGRTFGIGDAATLVAFQPLFNASSGELFVMTRERRGGQRVGTATVTHHPSGRQEKPSYFSSMVPKQNKRVTRINVSRDFWEGLGDTDVLAISAAPVSIRVKLVRFAAARAAFDKCEREVLAGWNVDPAALDPDKAPTPLRSPVRYFSPADYPTQAIQAGHVGRVVAILNVNAGGFVTDCRIGSSSWPDLNDATCKQGRRVRFTPARDATGRPTTGIYLLPVRWTMRGM